MLICRKHSGYNAQKIQLLSKSKILSSDLDVFSHSTSVFLPVNKQIINWLTFSSLNAKLSVKAYSH